jgi:hypothetical protein
MQVKRFLVLAVLCVALSALQAQSRAKKDGAPQRKLYAQLDNNRELPETETKRRKTPNQGMRRIRSKVFTVNILRFNKKIRQKHDREVAALDRYEARLKKQVARQKARKQKANDRKNARTSKKQAQ